MITAIVFSRNRAMQLDALLTSMELFTPGVFDVTVSYRYDSEEFEQGYKTVQREHPSAFLVKRCHLKADILKLLEHARANVAFFTDDDVFYRKISEREMKIPSDCLCFSPRLGLNTNYCYPMNRDQKVGELDFKYPWSIDGHVYRREAIVKRFLETGHFDTPNDLESSLQDRIDHKINWLEQSCLVNIPHNIVQSQYPNRNGGQSFKDLNRRFLAGERIDLTAMDFSNVRAAHQEISYRFRKV